MTEGYLYKGDCGATIDEQWDGDTQILQCNKGRGMQCEGGTYAQELCADCPHNPANKLQNRTERVNDVSRNHSRR